jgi:hypothetical protein
MISKTLALVLLVAGLFITQAQAYTTGNDTGGIIAWSPESEREAHVIAVAHCAYYGKEAYLTSVHRQYGNYIGFACAFPPGHVVHQRQHAIRVKG